MGFRGPKHLGSFLSSLELGGEPGHLGPFFIMWWGEGNRSQMFWVFSSLCGGSNGVHWGLGCLGPFSLTWGWGAVDTGAGGLVLSPFCRQAVGFVGGAGNLGLFSLCGGGRWGDSGA